MAAAAAGRRSCRCRWSWRGTSLHVCGLYPWSAPGPLPRVGVPVGRHLWSGETVCFDHINWFQAGFLANPSVLILAKPGLGKSTLCGKMCLGLVAQGYTLLAPGDTKPDLTQLAEQLEAEVRTVKRMGGWAINPCDPGGMMAAAARIGGDAGEVLRGEAIGRAVTLIAGLVELSRRGPVADYEEAIIGAALRELYERPGEDVPVIDDVLSLMRDRDRCLWDELELEYPDSDDDEPVDEAAVKEFDALVLPLRRSLKVLVGGGKYGDVFARRTTRRPWRTGMVIDTSAIKAGSKEFLGAVLLAAWADTHAQIEADNALADAGLGTRRLYCLVLDELWRVLELGGTMAERVNELTRLNRADGTGQIMISHSARDFEGTGSSRTDGIAERAGAVIIGGVPKKEVALLEELLTLTTAEKHAITSWWSMSQGAMTEPRRDRDGHVMHQAPPGAGKFLIKTSGDQPGIPVQVVLTSEEIAWGGQRTSARWHDNRPDTTDPTPGEAA